MREIIYLQAGSLTNHTGTHFWNTQEAYLSAEETEDELVEHARSFRESRTTKGETVYTPRLLIFDQKENFGNTANVSIQDTSDTDALEDLLWDGSSAQIRQDALPTSAYHAGLAASVHDDSAPNAVSASQSLYWADYSRVYYAPGTFQRVPDVQSDWAAGRAVFTRYDTDTDLLDTVLRRIIEECDSLQGVQLSFDTAPFGSFSTTLLSALRDDLPKAPVLALPLLGDATPLPGTLDVDDNRGLKQVLSDALVLREIDELGTLTVPIGAPKIWQASSSWSTFDNFDIASSYFASALLSSTIESATLPARLRRSPIDLTALCAQMGSSHFARLSGNIPASADTFDPTGAAHFSLLYNSRASEHARIDVTRGLSAAGVRTYDEHAPSSGMLLHTMHLPPYPLPSSFPGLAGRASTPAYASLSAGPGVAPLLRAYAEFVELAAKRNADAGEDIERDDLRALAADLWTMHDSYADESEGEEVVDDM